MKKKIKKIKLFFLAFLGVCLGLTSFSSADFNFDYMMIPASQNCTGYWYGTIPYNSRSKMCISLSDGNGNTFYVDANGFINGDLSDYFIEYYGYIYGGIEKFIDNDCSSVVYNYNGSSVLTGGDLKPYGEDGFYVEGAEFCDGFPCGGEGNGQGYLCLNQDGCASWNVPIQAGMGMDPSDMIIDNCIYRSSTLSGNLRQCLEDKNLLIGQVSTLSGSLSSCQSDLSDCMGGQDASLLACIDQKEQCESSLITLSGNYASLENMNSSLSSQLQECLESGGGSGSSELICNTFDLFWDSDNTRYSFPINNNLILPAGYKGFVNEGVLAIKQDNNNAYSISDEDFQNVMDSYGVVFLYLFGSALFLVFLYTIRKYFIGLKS